MNWSTRCSAAVVYIGCCMLFTIAVHCHTIPSAKWKKYDRNATLNLVESVPETQVHRTRDSVTASANVSELYRSQMERINSSLQTDSAGEISGNKRWKSQKITPPGRSRINNRSMTACNEIKSSVGPSILRSKMGPIMQNQTAIQMRQDTNLFDPNYGRLDGLTELLARASQSSDVEEYFRKYVLDGDVSASFEDDDEDDENDDDDDYNDPEARFKKKKKKLKYKKFLLPLLLAYKLKFMMMVPAMIGGLVLLVKAAGLAGFFFALFASVVSLQKHH
ncbi:uncharacterized protein LOC129762348 [Toxorhynchites rutilus septentrionalis]|uniref:uncharacterized protein LOC129762348 n=1 Tax=Toxorhynchites rutilus septentrionalis TaxID=329112 RepID=UPI00247885E1|nr:uncharacterized protein LOC129762348 [Toxorhynchites rutilus septentrionalis]